VIKGTITDSKTKEPIIGATIKIEGSTVGAKSRLNGTYIIKDAPAGNQVLKIKANGYKELDVPVTVPTTDEEVTADAAITYQIVKGEEIVVNGQAERGSESESQQTEKNSDNVVSAVSARAIEVSPDVNVANVSQRVAGVSMTRTATGDAHYAIIRGMDKRYNYTTVNGIKIPSPDNKNRYVPLDIFPSGLLDRLEVTKTLTPSMEPDATGGVMNLVMKQSPDHEILQAELGTGYSELFTSGQKFYSFTTDNNQSPRIRFGPKFADTSMAYFPQGTWSPKSNNFIPAAYMSATYGNRFGENQQFGMVIAGTMQNSYRGANTLFNQTNSDQITGLAKFTDFEYRTYSILQNRSGGMGNFDYHFNEDHSLQLFGMFASLNRQELRDLYDTTNTKGSTEQHPEIDRSIRATNETQTIGNVTLSGFHTILGKDLRVDWHAAYSKASLNSPDEAHLSMIGGADYRTTPITIIPYHLDDSKRIWQNADDIDKSLYLNLKTTEFLAAAPIEFSYGGMYRNKTRSSTYDQYNLNVKNGQQFYNNGSINTDTSFRTSNPFGDPQNALNYDAHENVTAGYIQVSIFPISDLQIIGGIRAENTDFGWVSSVDSLTTPGKTGTVSYLDLLPSVNMKYSPDPHTNWRAAYFRSISRPTFYELIPNAGIPGEDYTEVNNVHLNRTLIDNLDLRWEYFPGGLDQLLVGAFYKNLTNPIEWVVEFVSTNTVFKPENLGTATNFGFELDFRKFFSNFGVQGNYTFTKSQITTPKFQTHYVTGFGSVTDTAQETRPLEGQSAHIGNISLLYKNFESGTNAQISAVYTGEAITAVSIYKDFDVWQRGYIQLDLSGEQKIVGDLSVYLKINNLLNSAREEEIHQKYSISQYALPITGQTDGQNFLIRKELYNRNYILGLRFKM
jgi:outer membrane receptor protein involved in Fe transport